MIFETRKILEAPDIGISVTCARVPVISAHSESVNVQTRDPIEPDAVRELLRGAPGLERRRRPAEQRLPDRARRRRPRRGARRPDPPRSVAPARAEPVGRQRQPAQGRRDERGPDRRGAARARPRAGAGPLSGLKLTPIPRRLRATARIHPRAAVEVPSLDSGPRRRHRGPARRRSRGGRRLDRAARPRRGGPARRLGRRAGDRPDQAAHRGRAAGAAPAAARLDHEAADGRRGPAHASAAPRRSRPTCSPPGRSARCWPATSCCAAAATRCSATPSSPRSPTSSRPCADHRRDRRRRVAVRRRAHRPVGRRRVRRGAGRAALRARLRARRRRRPADRCRPIPRGPRPRASTTCSRRAAS